MFLAIETMQSLPQKTTDTKLLQVFEDIQKSIQQMDDIRELLTTQASASGYEEAWKKYHKVSGDGFDQMFKGWEVKVRSERRMGELLGEMELNKGIQMNGPRRLHDETAVKLDDLGITKTQSYRYQKLAKIAQDKFDKKIQELWGAFREPTTSALFKVAHVSHNTGENEWYTPPDIIEKAKRVMGEIELDPASTEKANETVNAKEYFDEEDDGLEKEWHGKVWMNPPYSQPLIDKFSEKVTEEYQARRIDEACVLVNNATETNWFQRMLKVATGVCFVKGRIRFIDQEGNRGDTPLQGQVIIYFGKNKEKFKANFGDIGTILWKEER